MQDKVVMVTGATDGIGLVTAHQLANMGAEVIVVGRDAEKGNKVIEEIARSSGNERVSLMIADLSSLQQVRQLAQTFNKEHTRLDVLVNNAGAIFTKRLESVDGYEMTFALNHLNYFLLGNLLLDTLKTSAPSRLINVSSAAHHGQTIDFDDIENRRNYQGARAYGQSKLANILFTKALAKRLKGTHVTTNAMHPGFVATRFGHNNGGLMRIGMSLAHLFALSPEQGAETIVHLASSPEVETVTGEYFANRMLVSSSAASQDAETAERLWEVSADMVSAYSNHLIE